MRGRRRWFTPMRQRHCEGRTQCTGSIGTLRSPNGYCSRSPDAAGFRVGVARQQRKMGRLGPPEAFTNSKHYRVPELSLHTESVSGFSAVSVVSAASRGSSGNPRKRKSSC
jgi:hypothetical protein